MTQRSLDEEGAPEDHSDAPAPPSPAPAPVEASEGPAPPARVQLDGPSDIQLRERQAAWFAERARHEEYRRRGPSDEASK